MDKSWSGDFDAESSVKQTETTQFINLEKPKIDYPSAGKSHNEGLSVNTTSTSRGIPTLDMKWLQNGAVLTSTKKTASLKTSQSGSNEGYDDFHLTLVVICEY